MYTTALARRPSLTATLCSSTGSLCSAAQAGVPPMLTVFGVGGVPV